MITAYAAISLSGCIEFGVYSYGQRIPHGADVAVSLSDAIARDPVLRARLARGLRRLAAELETHDPWSDYHPDPSTLPDVWPPEPEGGGL